VVSKVAHLIFSVETWFNTGRDTGSDTVPHTN
jgi:hypothetical protein